MIPHILTLNAGSSSIKFGLYRLPDGTGNEPPIVARGLVDGIGTGPWIKVKNASGAVVADRALPEEANHADGLQAALGCLYLESNAVITVGHRIAHGAPAFPKPIVIDQRVFAQLAGYTPFAPSHQPHNLKAVMAARKAFPKAVQVGCFDTSFHEGKAFVQDAYALPRSLYQQGIRRYGHHGLSYDYVSGALRKIAPQMADGKVVIAHLGNGASMCALSGGRSVETTMGFSALDGLPMGTRCGQIDPGIVLYLLEVKHLDVEEIETILYKESGLKGISGLTNDMRDLEAAGTPEAEDAIAYFTGVIRREIAGMAATLGGLDAVVFCGGIGENSVEVRRRVIEPLGWLGVKLDAGKNATRGETCISTPDSKASVYVIPTDEEIVIARACLAFIPQLADA
jgi:acetate kinase